MDVRPKGIPHLAEAAAAGARLMSVPNLPGE